MAQLIVRNIDKAIVDSLRARAAKHGRSSEAEHREILREALLERPAATSSTPAGHALRRCTMIFASLASMGGACGCELSLGYQRDFRGAQGSAPPTRRSLNGLPARTRPSSSFLCWSWVSCDRASSWRSDAILSLVRNWKGGWPSSSTGTGTASCRSTSKPPTSGAVSTCPIPCPSSMACWRPPRLLTT